MEELEIGLSQARSFPNLTPPNNAIEIGRKLMPSGITFILYRDNEWNYYYESDRGLAFKQEMERRRKEKKRSW